MKQFSLQKKMIIQIVLVCSFLVGISGLSLYFQKQVSTSYREVSSNQFPKVESLSKLIANFRLIRIKVRTLGLTGNTEEDQKKYINETKEAIGAFLAENKTFNAMSFTEQEKEFVSKMNQGWDSFFSFGKDLLSRYENPTEESLVKGSNMIRKICPIEANKWMSVAQSFLKYQSDKTHTQVAASIAEEKNIIMYSTFGLFISFILSVVAGFIFSRSITNKILFISNILKENTNKVRGSSESVSKNSNQLSNSSTSAASSLQETVSSIDEISSMIQKNAEAASSSTQVSTKSSEVASNGKKIVETMIESIKEISKNNNDIAHEMENNNKEISKIVEVISEIGEKTKVINDIVFQTKLLSFNASVEAARAGEHGKGFAVVAEEVGNLAAMSGTAALEITEMLEHSIKQVTDIVDNAKRKVEVLVSTSKEKVDTGTKTAQECGDSLDEILHNVSSVNDMVREIATASSEQSAGVQEVTRAMQQLDQATHENSLVAQKSSQMAQNLNEQAVSLDSAVKDLVALVNGAGEINNLPKVESSIESQDKDSTILSFSGTSQIKETSAVVAEKKVSGLDISIPDESDSRFEDL